MNRGKWFFQLCIIMLAGMMLPGCGKNRFELEFHLPDSYDNPLRIQYFAYSSHQAFREEITIPVIGGKGKVMAPVAHPTVVYLYPGASSTPALMFLADKGETITISGENSNVPEWSVDGSDINREWSQWRKDNADALRGQASEINKAVARYVEKNSDNPLSTLLLLTTYRRRDDENGYARLWKLLKGDATDMKYIRAVDRSDQQTSDYSGSVPIGEMRLYVKGDSMLNLSMEKSQGTLLYFWKGNASERIHTKDSLKNLYSRIEKDTLPLQIADISFDIDSVGWSATIRRDSVNGKWPRAWSPAGEMNPALRALDVPFTPYFIVIDNGGVQKYRGKDFAEAKKILLSLGKTKPKKKTDGKKKG